MNHLKTTELPSRDTSVSLLGCGWLGLPIAEKLIRSGFHVRGSTTTTSKLRLLSQLGIEALLMRIDPGLEQGWTPSPADLLFFSSRTMIVSLPPQAAFGADHFSSQLETILSRRHDGGFDHLIFVSSTSVYGSTQGRVDESSRLEPDTDSGEILAKAEARLTQAARERGFGLTIVRPGGLLGPGRHPGLFLAGRKGVKDPSSPVNMIHQMDCAKAIAALVVDPAAPGETRIFNLVSNDHPKRREFYTKAATAIGVDIPEFGAQTDESATKLVDSSKIRERVSFDHDDLLASLGVRA